MTKLNSHLNSLIERILIVAMIAIVAVVTWQVFSRFILRSPSSYTEELARFLLMWIGVLGASYAYRTRAHLGLDLFYQKMVPTLRRKCTFIIELSVLITASCILVYGGSLLMMLSFELEQSSAALGINMGFVYAVLPLSGLLIVFNCVENIVNCLMNVMEES
ncbi:TRAP transporter small permease [Pseudoalteromonas sp. SSMSWG5]|jgi:TRAP-type C4-dicarboxylate transport system permease small subunit|uniref:TRAP transporter small permease protein n=1 Tax=Pseudoalteromonas lipolytica TaxID=570156 RepID=A0AAD0WEH1_9GAMM|nr:MULTISPECIES: TRAP transporter small permease [Pseudoalteromonas]AXV67523.1 TRAP transporter small permease [Pseudoalteromonas donghaensis]EWH05349.1 C4-dicarboxylate ABC transporter permease [Pseudoalteromonas lipolytica SCSIO 04301]MCC9662021.1 TRAP transporter small permease [Pseudoalteromonas sp. MB41]QLJ10055.1 TRAP transporter small permease [Pseudoalteromonas sp. JSTW]QMW16253.1 TRAP transporter small permease [Pseudoalteromonas sp. MT33b]|tara:strand:- start:2336 stop:2821 length:486 start_codon:yes stop_codon:yes gene_type:complete